MGRLGESPKRKILKMLAKEKSLYPLCLLGPAIFGIVMEYIFFDRFYTSVGIHFSNTFWTSPMGIADCNVVW